MISVFQSGRRGGRKLQYLAALQGVLRAGERVVEFGPRGASRLELDDVGEIHRVPLAPSRRRAASP